MSGLAGHAPEQLDANLGTCGLCRFRNERWSVCDCIDSPYFKMRVEPGLRGCRCFRVQVPLSPFDARTLLERKADGGTLAGDGQ